ncbi:uncharacterized protein LOC111902933 [Lactuca sativa]|uniref:uncharacterized protein LOC111902933 n=1 Tax=Lactuca sativa TaxID=4236 RepID=UPI000CD87C9D|nr:uncharacterized protein LOC111902933 [Lactuca sativa]
MTWKALEKKSVEPIKPYHPPIPFPNRVRQDKNAEDYQNFLDHIRSLEINIPVLEALSQMLKYAKFVKDLLTNRTKIGEISKMGDLGSLTLPCQFGNLAISHALSDSGGSVKLMPYSFFKKLDLPEPRPIRMAIHLTNKMVTFPRGICEDLLVKVDKFVFPADFIVLDIDEDEPVPIILGRPILRTARALVDIRESKLTLRVGEEAVTFGFNREIKHSRISDYMAISIDVFGEILEKELGGWKEKETEGYMVLQEGDFDVEHEIQELDKLLEESE